MYYVVKNNTTSQLVLFGGLQRSGKSTAASLLEIELVKHGYKCRYFNSDSVRKDLARRIEVNLLVEGYTPDTDEHARLRKDRLYSDENRYKVYEELYSRASEYMLSYPGRIAIVDAAHITEKSRIRALEQISQKVLEFKYTYIEVVCSTEVAKQRFKDAESLHKTQGPPYYLKYDESEAHLDIRLRDEKRYEPVSFDHTKILNDSSVKDLETSVKKIFEDNFVKQSKLSIMTSDE